MRATRLSAAFLAMSLAASSCALRARPASVEPTREQMRQLWTDPGDSTRRDLFGGPDGLAAAPDPATAYTVISNDTRGASGGYTVTDRHGRRWRVKIGPEVRPEIVVSRLLWAVGYHQPPVYYVAKWTIVRPQGILVPQPPGRFRPESPQLKKVGEWAWHDNPFVGTRELGGLFVLMAIVNNWDLKTPQNVVYRVKTGDDVHTWYVVRDLGASLGRTQWFFPGTKDDVKGFESEPFVKEVRDGNVTLYYHGAWREPFLKKSVSVADVRWICQRLGRLTDLQWQDAFRAGGYEPAEAVRYIGRIKGKIAEGLALREEGL